jgi:hypothetical protein
MPYLNRIVKKVRLFQRCSRDIRPRRTGRRQPFAPGDPGMEFGVSLQYKEVAIAALREAVKSVLTSAFAATPPTAAPK